MTREFPQTLLEVVEHNARTCPHTVGFYRELKDGWEPYTNKQFYDHVQALGKSLQARGVRKGDRIGILARPCYEWEVADKAIMYLGGIVVGLDYKSSSSDLAHIIQTASLKGLFVENDEFTKLVPAEELGRLDFLYSFDPSPTQHEPDRHLLWDAIRRRGAAGERLCANAQPDDIGVIVFTSGTTGVPKGIPLRQHQLTANLPVMYKTFSSMLGSDDRTLAWVPLYNGTGRMMGSINCFLGVSQYFVKDPQTLFDKVKQVSPDYLVVVPRLLEKVYERVQDGLQERSRAVQLALGSLMTLRSCVPAGWIKQLTDWLLIGKLRRAIWGSKIQFLISGSAPVDANILMFFDSLGVPTYEVYGLSEIGSLISMNRPGTTKYGSVGQPLEGMDIKIAADNELLAKTSAAAENYWGETPGANGLFDGDGYLKTGDLAEIRDAFLYIIGRKKEIIKTSTGQRISPVAVEATYKNVPGVDQIVVIGNGRKYLTALVTVDEGFHRRMAEQGRTIDDYLNEEFAKRSSQLASNRQIKRFTVLPSPLSVADGELTPMLKLRRSTIEEKYQTVVDSMYT